MQSIGERLRKARNEKNISLDEVYKQTKIYPNVLEALEQDRAHNFLSPLYIKGFLKTYAEYLGLEGERLLKEYTDNQKPQAQAAKAVSKKKHKTLEKINLLLISRVALAIVLFLALIFYFRFVATHISRSAAVAEVKEQKVRVEVLPAPRVVVEDLVLEVRTLDSCWLRVRADEEAIFATTLPKGKTERWQASEKIELRIGKPEALEVFLNGKPVDLRKAKVKRSLIVTHEGIVGK